MRTLKRIGLFLLLKVLEIVGIILACAVILGLISIGGYGLGLVMERFGVSTGILLASGLFIITNLKDLHNWCRANWDYVKRKIK